ncbi:MAG: T9SS type A sorting domain-containing protein, partial [Chitinophagaceae bacterium]
WTRFTVEKKNQAALLNWQTAAEQNNDRFEIERSSNGIQFITIGIVKSVSSLFGAGYSFEDTRPLVGINYYRLKQVDMDGKFIYSRVVQLNFVINSNIKFFPNPAKNTLYINMPFPEIIQSAIILDFTGRIVQRSVTQNSSSISLPIQQLEAGTYGIYLETSKGKYNIKFIKQ